MYYGCHFRKQAPPLCLAERGPGGEVLFFKSASSAEDSRFKLGEHDYTLLTSFFRETRSDIFGRKGWGVRVQACFEARTGDDQP